MENDNAALWTRPSLCRLLHALALAQASPSLASRLLPHVSEAQLVAVVTHLSVSLGSPAACTVSQHARFVLRRVSNFVALPSTSAARSAPSPGARQSCAKRTSRRVVIQLVPLSQADAKLVHSQNKHPFLELALRSSRPLWDVLAHVHAKWSLSIRLITLDHLPVHTTVSSIVPSTSTLIRLQYSILRLSIDYAALSIASPAGQQKQQSQQPQQPQQPSPSMPARDATTEDDQFWTTAACASIAPPSLDMASDSLFEAAVLPNSSTYGVEQLAKRRANKRRISAPLPIFQLVTSAHQTPPQKTKPARVANTKKRRYCPPASGEQAVLKRLRSHLQQLSQPPLAPATSAAAPADVARCYDIVQDAELGTSACNELSKATAPQLRLQQQQLDQSPQLNKLSSHAHEQAPLSNSRMAAPSPTVDGHNAVDLLQIESAIFPNDDTLQYQFSPLASAAVGSGGGGGGTGCSNGAHSFGAVDAGALSLSALFRGL